MSVLVAPEFLVPRGTDGTESLVRKEEDFPSFYKCAFKIRTKSFLAVVYTSSKKYVFTTQYHTR